MNEFARHVNNNCNILLTDYPRPCNSKASVTKLLNVNVNSINYLLFFVTSLFIVILNIRMPGLVHGCSYRLHKLMLLVSSKSF